jgi:hypothetical protein
MGRKRTKGKAGYAPWTSAEWAVLLRAWGYLLGRLGFALWALNALFQKFIGA